MKIEVKGGYDSYWGFQSPRGWIWIYAGHAGVVSAPLCSYYHRGGKSCNEAHAEAYSQIRNMFRWAEFQNV